MKKKVLRAQVTAPNLPERIDKLSVKRHEIIPPILEHPKEYVLLSVRSMAERLSTDPATVVRIVRGLGFDGYRDFQKHLHELSLAFASPRETSQTAGDSSNMQVSVRNALTQNLKNLQGLKNSLDGQRLTDLAKPFYRARQIGGFAG